MPVSDDDPNTRLVRHLESWLGAWPPPSGKLVVVGSERREQPGWDGRIQQVTGVATPEGAVLSVPTAAAPDVQALTNGDLESLDWLGQRLGEVLGRPRARFGRGIFRWSAQPADLRDAGEWVDRDDPRVPEWLHPFNSDVLVAWDDEGRYGSGVGRKQHDRFGHELAVATEPALQGRGIARRLVAQAARQVLADGAVPTYLHDPSNIASAHVAEAAGFPDIGWHILGLWGA